MSEYEESGSESSASDSEAEGPWAEVVGFEDLVELNTQFLQGLLESTPYHSAPTDAETALIIDDLQALCQAGGGVFTTSSQPARATECVWQRGYVRGAWRGDPEALETALLDRRLEYVLVSPVDGVRVNVRTDADQLWTWTRARRHAADPWRHQTGLSVDQLTDVMELDCFDTAHYSLISDPTVVVFTVADKTWGREAGACVRAVRAAIEEAAAATA